MNLGFHPEAPMFAAQGISGVGKVPSRYAIMTGALDYLILRAAKATILEFGTKNTLGFPL